MYYVGIVGFVQGCSLEEICGMDILSLHSKWLIVFDCTMARTSHYTFLLFAFISVSSDAREETLTSFCVVKVLSSYQENGNR